MLSTVAPPELGTYRFDPVHTFAEFGVKHAIVGRVDGRFNSIEGEFVVADESQLFDSILVKIEGAGIDTKVQARDDDLRSDRFFNVAKFPQLVFRGVDSHHAGDQVCTVRGDLTIREVTRRITLEVTVRGATIDQHGKTRLGLSATSKLRRSDFDLTTELLQESGSAEDADIVIRVDAEAVLESTDPSSA